MRLSLFSLIYLFKRQLVKTLCIRIGVLLISEETVHDVVGLHNLLLLGVAQSRVPELHAAVVIRKVLA
jgi:hypothetical protein